MLEESPGGKRNFRFIRGPIFGQLLMADEINRASPRTQSALLQAMQEQHVTVAGVRHDLPKPFPCVGDAKTRSSRRAHIPCPRRSSTVSVMQVDVDYPNHDAERRILFDTTGAEQSRPRAAMRRRRLARRAAAGAAAAGRGNLSCRQSLGWCARRGRGPEAGELGKLIAWGPGATCQPGADACGARARAARRGGYAPSVDDVLDLAEPVLKHRMALTFSARAEGETIGNVINRIKSRIG